MCLQSEIETADFDKLLSKMERVSGLPEVLRNMLVLIKDSGQPRPGTEKPSKKFLKDQNIFDFL